jgi:hypothetical protein
MPFTVPQVDISAQVLDGVPEVAADWLAAFALSIRCVSAAAACW